MLGETGATLLIADSHIIKNMLELGLGLGLGLGLAHH